MAPDTMSPTPGRRLRTDEESASAAMLDHLLKIATEQVERAFMEERDFEYIYEDDAGYNFMDPETYDQISVPKDIVGEQSVYLQEQMRVILMLHEGVPVSIQLPQRVTVEIVEADPVVKGQTASSSYKPAVADNGMRVMVPPHIAAGTRVVIMTEDGSYVERAKD